MRTFLLILLLPGLVLAAQHSVTQGWADTTTTGVFEDADYGDTLAPASDLYFRKWGIVLDQHRLTLDGGGHTIHYDTVDIPALSNPSFEITDGDTVAYWDLSEADSCRPFAGDTTGTTVDVDVRCGADIESYCQVHKGSYSLAAWLPCDTQKVTATEALTFAEGVHWSIGVFIHNKADGNVRFHLRLLDDADSARYWQTWNYGTFTQGLRYLYIDFIPADSDYVLTPQIMVTGGGSGCGPVFLDDIRIGTYGYAGLAVGAAKSDARKYFDELEAVTPSATNGTYCYSLSSQYPSGADDADSCTIIDLTIIDDGYSLCGRSYFVGDNHATLYNCDAVGNGWFGGQLDLSGGYGHRISNCRMKMVDGFEAKREWTLCASVFLDGNAGNNTYPRDVRIDSSYFWGSRHVGITCKTLAISSVDAGDTTWYEGNPVVLNADTISMNNYYSNGFAVFDLGEAPSQGSNLVIINYDGSDTVAGSGLQISGKRYSSPIEATWDNLEIKAAALPRNPEQLTYSLAYGIQVEGCSHITVSNSDIGGYGFEDADLNTYAQGLRLNFDSPSHNLAFRQTIFRGYGGNDANTAPAFAFAGMYGGLDYDGTNHSNWTFDTCSFYANGLWIGGMRHTVDGLTFLHPTFKVDTTVFSLLTAHDWFTGYYNSTATNGDSILFVDPQFADAGADSTFDSAYVHQCAGCSADTSSQYFKGWTVMIDINGDGGAPVASAPYRVVDTNGDTLYSGTANGSGLASLPVWEYREHAPAATYNRDNARSYFNDYTFVAWDTEWSVSDTQVVDIDDAQTVTLTLAGEAGDGDAKKVLIRK